MNKRRNYHLRIIRQISMLLQRLRMGDTCRNVRPATPGWMHIPVMHRGQWGDPALENDQVAEKNE
jgi:hypothetical protein